MRAVLLSLLVAYVAATPADKCSLGESYHCSSIKTAVECGAFDHCKDTVWKYNIRYQQDGSEVCDFCENVIGDVRTFLDDGATRDAVKQYLESACNMIPVAELAQICKDTIDDDLEQLWNLIDSVLDPKAVCAAMGLCSGFEDLAHHAEPEKKPELHHVSLQKEPVLIARNEVASVEAPSGDICADCKAFIGDVRDQITDDTTEQEIEQLLKDQICSQLGTFASECDTLVEEYVPEILEMLAAQVDPDVVCMALGVCSGGEKLMLAKMKLKKSPLYKAAVQAASAEECLLCKTVFSELQNLDRDPSVQAEVKDFLKTNLCDKLGNYKDECVSSVDLYGTMIFELLATELDPATRCTALGFCAAREAKIQSSVAGLIREAMPIAGGARVAKEEKKALKSTQCEFCKLVMGELESLLKQNTTEDEIIAALDKVCSVLPDTIALECENFVETYGPALLELITQELSPDVICSTLGLCSVRGNQLRDVHINPALLPKKKVGTDEYCGVCETIIQYVDSLLEQNATVAEIEAALEKVCNYLPDTYATQCTEFIEEYGALLISLLTQELTPLEVCTELGLCSGQMMAPFEVIQPVKAQLLGTNECTYGPAFWCVNEDNAKKCNAMDHCQQKVWIKN